MVVSYTQLSSSNYQYLEQSFIVSKMFERLTLLLLNTTCHALANSVDPDQLASEEAN